LGEFVNDADMLGTTLSSYGQNVVTELIAVGRAGTLVDWEGEVENRVYVSRYVAEDILNWKTERINGRNLLTLVVLHEMTEVAVPPSKQGDGDEFEVNFVEQIRVLKLVAGLAKGVGGRRKRSYECQVEIWQLLPVGRQTVIGVSPANGSSNALDPDPEPANRPARGPEKRPDLDRFSHLSA
jgi:hypothetical protein